MKLLDCGVIGGTIVLSRRNLLALLHKLDKPGSLRTIVLHEPLTDRSFAVKAEEDQEHYTGREWGPGQMTADTEAFIAASHDANLLNSTKSANGGAKE